VLLDAAYGKDGAATVLTPGHAFQIASISKTFTAACVLLLLESDRLALDDALANFVNRPPPSWSAITVRHLLTHTSGLGHWHDVAGLDMYAPCTREELLERIAATPPRFGPGDGWSYSSPGYVLLAHIIEAVAGIAYPEFLTHRVLGPLGLENSAVVDPPGNGPSARGSVGGVPTRSFDLGSVNRGTGDVWSTATDLARWPRAIASSDLLSWQTRAMMFSAQARIADREAGLTDVGYGLGWFTAHLGRHRLVFHSGDQPGFTALLVWAPEPDLVAAVLASDEIGLGPLVLPALEGLLMP
jgi:CubicO group peptidase (beta-lactamase class C family)